MPAPEPLLICDLDGTVLRINSFPYWIAYLIGGPLPGVGWRARLRLSLRVQILLSRRKLRLIDHARLMREAQHAWHEAIGVDNDAAAARVRRLFRRRARPMLEPLLRRIAAGEIDAILATAAAGEYAIGLGHDLGFRQVLATPCRMRPDQKLNAGARKMLNVMTLLGARNWEERPLVLLTDHLDDLPLMRHCDAVGWFGSASDMARASVLAQGAKFIFCRDMDDKAFAVALAELSAHAASVVSGTIAL